MDIVVTTPHGDADIEVVAAPADATLGELLHTVTGQSPPVTARVDGRTVDCSQRLGDVRLSIGSTIDTRPVAPPLDDRGGVVALVQLAGRGAGTVRHLEPGRYRIGPARSTRNPELAEAPVDSAAFELAIDGAGGARVTPDRQLAALGDEWAPTLAGERLERPTQWVEGRLSVGGRWFELERPPEPIRRRAPVPAADGTVPFRRGATAPSADRPLVVGALRDAARGGGELWRWRPGDRGAYRIGYGLRADGTTRASIDLLEHRGVALVGSERFRSALARTVLVELCTMHAPSTVDVVVATDPERDADWDWARWIPHARSGHPTGSPSVHADPTSLGRWLTSFSERTAVSSGHRLTVIVLDGRAWWTRRDSPLLAWLSDPRDDVRFVALCGPSDDIPHPCSEVVHERTETGRAPLSRSARAASAVPVAALEGPLATQYSATDPAAPIIADVMPALVEPDVAMRMAHDLAPLDDLDLVGPTPASGPPTVAQLVAASSAGRPDSSRLTVTIGVPPGADTAGSTRRDVTIELDGTLSTIITAAGVEHRDRAVAALVLGAASQRTPDELAVVILGGQHRPWHDRLPHVAGWAGRSEAADPTRVIHRIAHVASERPDLHLLVVVRHAFDHDDPLASDAIAAWHELAITFGNVHLVLTGDHPGSVSAFGRASCGALILITPSGDGTVWYPNRSLSFVSTPAPDAEVASARGLVLGGTQLLVRPIVQGREWSPLERRLDRLRRTDRSTADLDDGIESIARQISDRVGEVESSRRPLAMLPPPLPTEVDASALFAAHPGDGVPIGLVDRPEHADHDVAWWRPGPHGSIVVVGSARSEVASVIDVISLGIATRFSADDLHLYAIDASEVRRRALSSLPHAADVVDADLGASAVRLISGLREMLTQRLQHPTRADRPDIVLLIGDLGRMRRSLSPQSSASAFVELGELMASGMWVGINVVVAASRVDDLGGLDRVTAERLVGPLGDPDDRSRLGVGAVDAIDQHPRRCWSTSADRRVQLATPPRDLIEEIGRFGPEPAVYRPPTSIVEALGR